MFDDGDPPGVGFLGLYSTPGGGSDTILGCAPMQGQFTAYAKEGGLIWAMGPSLWPGIAESHPLLTASSLGQLAPECSSASGFRSIASDEDKKHLYVAIEANSVPGKGAPMLRYSPADNTAEVVLTLAEQDSVTGNRSWIRNIAWAGNNRLYIMYKGNVEYGALAVAELDKPEGQRLKIILTSEQLQAALENVTMIPQWGGPLAVDDKGRAFFVAWPYIEYTPPGTSQETVVQSCALVRVDPDGTVTNMLGYEVQSVDFLSPLWNAQFPCFGVAAGLAFDPETGFLVGQGAGLWLLDPDKPGFSAMLVHNDVVLAAAAAFDPKLPPSPNTAVLSGQGCVAPQGDGWFGAAGPIFYQFSVDLGFLDIDDDGLKGYEEAEIGTDPQDADTDGGGISDFMEVVDFTDPLVGDDDRYLGEIPGTWSMGGQVWGSTFESSLGGQHMSRFGVALPNGTIGMPATTGSDASNLYVFRDWGTPAQPTNQAGAPSNMVVGPDGSVYGIQTDGPALLASRMPPDGGIETVFTVEQLSLLMDELSARQAQSVAVEPNGRVWAGFPGGRIVRSVAGGGVEKVYDATKDMVGEGWFNEDGTCAIPGCQIAVTISAMAYEPAHGVLYFGLTREISCAGGSASSPVLGAILPDGRFRKAANITDWPGSIPASGGSAFKDIEPDGFGGVFLLLYGLLDRSLVNINAAWEATEITRFEHPWTSGGSAGTTSEFAHADALMMTREGRLFSSTGGYYNQYPTYFGLAEIVPIDDTVTRGQFLVVHSGAPSLGKVLAQGGGINLVWGKPLVRPTAVAATEEKVAVADALAGGVLVFPVDSEGTLGEGSLAGSVEAVGGVENRHRRVDSRHGRGWQPGCQDRRRRNSDCRGAGRAAQCSHGPCSGGRRRHCSGKLGRKQHRPGCTRRDDVRDRTVPQPVLDLGGVQHSLHRDVV